MDDQLVQQLEMLSSQPWCGSFTRRIAADLAGLRREVHGEAWQRLEGTAARILGRQLALGGDAWELEQPPSGLADTLYEIVLRLAPAEGALAQ